MPENTIKCQGLACPGPVIQTKKFIDANNPSTITVIVDNAAANENVSRLLSTSGYSVVVDEKNGIFTLSGTQQEGVLPVVKPSQPPLVEDKILVVISSEFFGSGDDDLGAKLMTNFIGSLPELSPQLWRIILLNSGVKLCVKDSPAINHLLSLASEGVNILACGTCLEHFGLLQNKAVGETTNMLDVVTSMQLASKIIRI